MGQKCTWFYQLYISVYNKTLLGEISYVRLRTWRWGHQNCRLIRMYLHWTLIFFTPGNNPCVSDHMHNYFTIKRSVTSQNKVPVQISFIKISAEFFYPQKSFNQTPHPLTLTFPTVDTSTKLISISHIKILH